MAKDCSFDIVSEFDRQELVNVVDQVKRDVSSRFDLKDSGSSVELEADKTITITTSDEMKLRNIYDILQSKLVKRNLSIRILDPQPIENALGGKVRQVYKLRKGLNQELAKKIVADIKDSKDLNGSNIDKMNSEFKMLSSTLKSSKDLPHLEKKEIKTFDLLNKMSN